MSVGVHPRPRDAKWVRFEDLPKMEIFDRYLHRYLQICRYLCHVCFRSTQIDTCASDQPVTVTKPVDTCIDTCRRSRRAANGEHGDGHGWPMANRIGKPMAGPIRYDP